MGDQIAIFTCARDSISCRTIKSVMSLLDLEFKFNWAIQEAHPIGRARSIAASQFLRDTEIPYMLFVDGDMVFEKGTVLGILDSLKRGHDVVSALYPAHDEQQLIFSAKEGDSGDYPFNSLQEARCIGMGLAGISRDILEKIQPTLKPVDKEGPEWYPFFECHITEGRFWGEDCDFCEKVRSVGGKVLVHTGLWAGHIKNRVCTVANTIENIKGREAAKLNKAKGGK